jgi:hypothetical protein
MAFQNVDFVGSRKRKPPQLGVKQGMSPLPSGSGFDRLVRRRADKNNLPGPVNQFGDRITGPAQKNTQMAKTGYGGRAFYGGNPRAGQSFRSGLTKSGNTVHLYGNGQRVVLPKKRAKFSRYG